MYDANYAGLTSLEVLAIFALLVLAGLLLFWFFGRRGPDDIDAPGMPHAPEQPQQFVAKPERPTAIYSDLSREVQTLRAQLDAEVLARLAAEKKLQEGAGALDPLRSEIAGLQQANNDLALQNNDLLKRLDSAQEDQMRVVGRLNNEIAALKGQIEQAPSAAMIADLRAQADDLKRANADLGLQKNDLLKRLDGAQEDQMRTVGRLNEEIAALKTQIAQAPGEAMLATLRGEVTTLKQTVDTLNVQNNDLLRRLDSAQEDQMRVVAKLNEDLGAAGRRATSLDSEIGRLKLQLSQAPADLSGEVARLKAQIAQAPADLSGEVRRLSEQLALATRERDDARALERNLADRVRVAEHDLGQARSGLEELGRLSAERQDEVQRLKVQLASMPNVDEYRRFKDALEAANRIASGQKA